MSRAFNIITDKIAMFKVPKPGHSKARGRYEQVRTEDAVRMTEIAFKRQGMEWR